MSAVTKTSYKIKDFVNYRTSGVVYQITCPCLMDYVGKKTRELCCRVGEHQVDIRRREETPVAMHIHEKYGGSTEGLRFKIIEWVRPSV